MLALNKMRIRNFRSFIDEEINFDEITTIVGPNEGGKTNVLDAISHLNFDKSFTDKDLRRGSKNYPYGVIEIEYTIFLNSRLIPSLIDEIPALNNKKFIISKRGKTNEDPKITYSLNEVDDIDKIISIKKPNKFKKSLDPKIVSKFEKDIERKWFARKKIFSLSKKPFPKLKKDKTIKILSTDQEVTSFLSKEIFNEIKDKIKIYFWRYDENEFLTNIVPIEEFIEDPSKYSAIKNVFEITGWKSEDFKRYLKDVNPTDSKIKIEEVERRINKIIKKTWRQHENLKISITHRENDLLILIKEKDSIIEPELRSEGLKWFLSFLINFRSKSEYLNDYIILIDEPALHLHPRGQKDVLSEIKRFAGDNQIVYTTHQTFMIDKNCPERVKILIRVRTKVDKSGYYFASEIKDELEDKDIILDPLLREALGFNVSDISPINENNVLVEGNFDRKLILLLNRYFPTIDLENYSIISCKGASGIKGMANFLLGNDLSFFCLYDSDKSGKDFYDDTSENIIPKKNKTHLQLLDKSLKSVQTPEDLFLLILFKEAVNKVKELKNFRPNNTKPKAIQLKEFFESSNLDKKEKSIIKHKLEDALLKKLKIELDNKKISHKSNLIKFFKALGSKL